MSQITPEPPAHPAPPPKTRLAPLLGLAIVAAVTAGVVLVVLLANPGPSAVKSGKVTVHYSAGVSRGKAQRLARYLEVEELGDGNPVEARLTRDGEVWVVDLFVKKTPQNEKSPQFHGLVKILHDIIRSRILKEDQVRLRVCDRIDIEDQITGRAKSLPWKEVGP